ncbi:MAG: hypothetical protein COA79_15695 [Planctomycetota bacterium]|nr:MAG: hypothetical protein COA79_15695 [Planctomycetota bacterium]
MIESKKIFILSIFSTILALLILVIFRPYVSWRHDRPLSGFRDNWDHSINFITIGDSRTLLGIDPINVINKYDIKLQGANFGFNSVAFSKKYLLAAENKLVYKGKRIILLGISPLSLSPNSFNSNAFKNFSKCSNATRLYEFILSKKRFAFTTLKKTEIQHILSGCKWRPNLEITIQNSGWTPAIWKGAADDRANLLEYQNKFNLGKIESKRIDLLINIISSWHDKGIKIFGFRPPVTKKMYDLENELSGFDEISFIEKFKNAGGNWIQIPPYGKYHCYDGSHISKISAIMLSDNVGKEIKMVLDEEE